MSYEVSFCDGPGPASVKRFDSHQEAQFFASHANGSVLHRPPVGSRITEQLTDEQVRETMRLLLLDAKTYRALVSLGWTPPGSPEP